MNRDMSEFAAINMRNQNVVLTKTDTTGMTQFRYDWVISLTKGVVWMIDIMKLLFDDLIKTRP